MTLLPAEKTKPSMSPEDLVTLLYGAPKVGKSTWASKIPGALFLATEPGLRALSVSKLDIPDWSTFLLACKEIKEGQHPYKTIVIDTVSLLWPLATDYVCKKNGVDYIGDLPFGKGFTLAWSEVNRTLSKLGQLSYGLILIGHDQTVELTTRTGLSYSKVTLGLPERIRRTILAMADLILFSEVYETKEEGFQRVVRTKPTMLYDAGDRTGLLPESFPLDYDLTLDYLTKNVSKTKAPGRTKGQKSAVK